MSGAHPARDVVTVLRRLGYRLDRQTGSHARFVKEGSAGVTVPIHSGDLAPTTFRSILRDMGVTHSTFEQLLRGE